MPTSVFGADVNATLAVVPCTTTVVLPAGTVTFPTPFASPEDWRDQWIYFLMVDRFNNAQGPPRSTTLHPAIAWEAPFGEFQGGTLTGITAQLDHLKQLGAGALWLTPVLKNCQYEAGTFHGYGIQDFLTVEPRFGTTPALAPTELRSLVDAAHARGLYVILDIVLNHAGNVFGYVRDGQQNASDAPFAEQPYSIAWHDEHGQPFTSALPAAGLGQPDAAVWPQELQRNASFRRQGKGADVPRAYGDFASLKQLVSEDRSVDRVLIRAYQYVIAAFDVDGFRIDTFKLPDPDFGHTFCASMREFALSIGKKNFFTFGEITTGEEGLAAFIGRDTKDATSDTIGIDAALDFSLEGSLNKVIKGLQPMSPLDLAQLYAERKRVERTVITTHGEASGFFVTFLDNHDRQQRFYFPRRCESPSV